MKRLIILLLLVPFWGMAQTVKEPSAGGFDDPTTTTGDIIYRDASGNLVRLAVGGLGEVLKSTGTIPEWGAGSGAWTEDVDSVTVAAGKLVGIGLTDPLKPLVVETSAASIIDISTTSSASYLSGITCSYNQLAKSGFLTNILTGEIRIGGITAGYYPVLYSGNSEALRITTNGNVGIGTTSPAEKLDIGYASGVFLRSFRGTTDTDITGWITTNANGDTCYMYPNAAGNGIEVSTTKP